MTPHRHAPALRRHAATLLVLLAAPAGAAEPAEGVDPDRMFSLQVEPADPADWLPLAVGTTWTYEHVERIEAEDGQVVTARWTEELAVAARRPLHDGLLVERTRRILSRNAAAQGPTLGPDARPATDWLILGGRVWEIAGPQDPVLLDPGRRDEQPPDLFFPLEVGLRWAERRREAADLAQAERFRRGAGGAPNPGMYYWIVEGREPVTVPGRGAAEAYLATFRTLGGPTRRWFVRGVGVVRETYRHQGTFQEVDVALTGFRRPPAAVP